MEARITGGGETSSSATEEFTEVKVEAAPPSITGEVSAGVASAGGVREAPTAETETEASVCSCR